MKTTLIELGIAGLGLALSVTGLLVGSLSLELLGIVVTAIGFGMLLASALSS